MQEESDSTTENLRNAANSDSEMENASSRSGLLPCVTRTDARDARAVFSSSESLALVEESALLLAPPPCLDSEENTLI